MLHERWEREDSCRACRSRWSSSTCCSIVVKARKVYPEGFQFQGPRYDDPILAAYVGEAITLRYDPRDMAEVRVFHQNQVVCGAICPERAGETLLLRDIVQALLCNRKNTVDALLASKRGEVSPQVYQPLSNFPIILGQACHYRSPLFRLPSGHSPSTAMIATGLLEYRCSLRPRNRTAKRFFARWKDTGSRPGAPTHQSDKEQLLPYPRRHGVHQGAFLGAGRAIRSSIPLRAAAVCCWA